MASPHLKRILFLACLFCATAPYHVGATTTIDSTNKYAWGANIGFTNWRPSDADGVAIGENFCSAYIYAANVGWISLGSGNPTNGIQYSNTSATDFGVNCLPGAPGERNLRGFAYGANIGWINFEENGNPRVILSTGQLRGFVYSANCGWINLDDATVFVQTTVATPTPTATPSSTPTPPPPTATPTPTLTPTPTPTVTPTPTPPSVAISGLISYCSNPSAGPVPNVTLTMTGTTSGSTTTSGSGTYTLAPLSGGTYTVTPGKAALAAGSAGISTIDVLAIQRHFLNIALIPPGCRLSAADVNNDTSITTIDVVATQRFFLGFTTGTASVGKYQFTPPSRAYLAISGDQVGQDYNALIFGDVAGSFVHRPGTPSPDEVIAEPEPEEAPSSVETVAPMR